MTRTTVIRVLAATALALFCVWIARNTYFEDVTERLPLKGEAQTRPHYALEQLLRHLGVEAQRVSTLQAPPRHAVLMTDGVERDQAGHGVDALEPWVRAGGHLVVNWFDVLRPSFQTWTGIRPPPRPKSPKPPAAAPTGDKPAVRIERATGSGHDACTPVQMHRGERTESLSLCGSIDVALTSQQAPTWHVSREERTLALSVPVGRGRVTVLPTNAVYQNRNLARDDNARILLAALELGHGDVVYVYDILDAENLARLLWRLIAPGLVLIAIAVVLLILRELPRFGTPIPAPLPLRRSLAEQIRATATLAWRTRRLHALRRAVNRALEEAARRQIAAFRLLDSRRRTEMLAGATGLDATVLRAAMTEAATADADIQRQAIVTLMTARKRFMQRSSTQGPP